jgi:hypothetical protein
MDCDWNHSDAGIIAPGCPVGSPVIPGPAVRNRDGKADAQPGERTKLRPVGRIGVEMGNDDSPHVSEPRVYSCSRKLAASEFSGLTVAGAPMKLPHRMGI